MGSPILARSPTEHANRGPCSPKPTLPRLDQPAVELVRESRRESDCLDPLLFHRCYGRTWYLPAGSHLLQDVSFSFSSFRSPLPLFFSCLRSVRSVGFLYAVNLPGSTALAHRRTFGAFALIIIVNPSTTLRHTYRRLTSTYPSPCPPASAAGLADPLPPTVSTGFLSCLSWPCCRNKQEAL